jgi:hypothetical protein
VDVSLKGSYDNLIASILIASMLSCYQRIVITIPVICYLKKGPCMLPEASPNGMTPTGLSDCTDAEDTLIAGCRV